MERVKNVVIDVVNVPMIARSVLLVQKIVKIHLPVNVLQKHMTTSLIQNVRTVMLSVNYVMAKLQIVSNVVLQDGMNHHVIAFLENMTMMVLVQIAIQDV